MVEWVRLGVVAAFLPSLSAMVLWWRSNVERNRWRHQRVQTQNRSKRDLPEPRRRERIEIGNETTFHFYTDWSLRVCLCYAFVFFHPQILSSSPQIVWSTYILPLGHWRDCGLWKFPTEPPGSVSYRKLSSPRVLLFIAPFLLFSKVSSLYKSFTGERRPYFKELFWQILIEFAQKISDE